jgi:hypothetical protein
MLDGELAFPGTNGRDWCSAVQRHSYIGGSHVFYAHTVNDLSNQGRLIIVAVLDPREGPRHPSSSRYSVLGNPWCTWLKTSTIDSQMAVRLSALIVGRPLPPGRVLVLISVKG